MVGQVGRIDQNRICARVYRFRKEHLLQNRSGFCNMVRDLLTTLNLQHIWESEEVGDASSWSKLINAKIRDRESGEWKKRVLDKPKLRQSQIWKTDLTFEDYLTQVTSFQHRREITRFTCGTHDLRVETGRREKAPLASWDKLPLEYRTCYLCMSSAVETEEHVLLDCPAYNPLRWKLLASIRNCTDDTVQLSWRGGDREWLSDFLLGHGASGRFRATVWWGDISHVRCAIEGNCLAKSDVVWNDTR